MSTDSIPVGLQNLLSKHYFLSTITRGYKPCMSSMTLVDGSSWWGALYRSYHGESRKSVMTDIEKIISETIDAIKMHSGRKTFLSLIINALAGTRVAIESMTTTYKDDPDMISRIRVQLQNIDLQLDRYRHMIKGYVGDDIKDYQEKIIDAVVNSSDTADKAGLKNFLMGKTPSPTRGLSVAESERMDRVHDRTERMERRRMRRQRHINKKSDNEEDDNNHS